MNFQMIVPPSLTPSIETVLLNYPEVASSAKANLRNRGFSYDAAIQVQNHIVNPHSGVTHAALNNLLFLHEVVILDRDDSASGKEKYTVRRARGDQKHLTSAAPQDLF